MVDKMLWVSADPFGDSAWHGCLVVAGASPSLGADVRFLLIALMLPPVAPQAGLRVMVDVVYVSTDHLAGEGTRKRGDCVSHRASAGAPVLEDPRHRRSGSRGAPDAALVSGVMTRTQSIREKEYRDGTYA